MMYGHESSLPGSAVDFPGQTPALLAIRGPLPAWHREQHRSFLVRAAV